MRLILTGTAVTFDADRRVLQDAAVYITDDTIEAVQPRSQQPPAGYAQAPRVSTDGFIYPGLIDLHSHLALQLPAAVVGAPRPALRQPLHMGQPRHDLWA